MDDRSRAPIPPPSRAMPLEKFPPGMREEILWAVAQPTPPDKWIYFGPPGAFRPLAMMESRAWYEWHWARGVDPDKKRQPLPAWVRQFVIERDGLVCRLCDLAVDRADVHIDHIVPVIRGGGDNPNNLQVTHSLCNLRKGAGQ